MLPLGVIDRLDQCNRLLHVAGQCRPAQRDAGIGQTLVLAIQGQVIEKLVDQQAGQETDIGQAALQHAARCRDLHQGRLALVPDHRSAVLQHHVATPALCQLVRDLVVDDLVLVGLRPMQLRCR